MTDLETTLSAITRMAEEVKRGSQRDDTMAYWNTCRDAAPALASAVLALVEVVKTMPNWPKPTRHEFASERSFAVVHKRWTAHQAALSRLSTLKETRG